MGASVKQIKPEPMGINTTNQLNSQVLMEDQGDKVLKRMMGNPLSQQSKKNDYANLNSNIPNLPKREVNTVPVTAHNKSESKRDMIMSNKKASENDTFSHLQASAAKRSSVISRGIDSAYGGRNSILGS